MHTLASPSVLYLKKPGLIFLLEKNLVISIFFLRWLIKVYTFTGKVRDIKNRMP